MKPHSAYSDKTSQEYETYWRSECWLPRPARFALHLAAMTCSDPLLLFSVAVIACHIAWFLWNW